jgi:Domain of unknown function (DUF222)
MGWDRDSISAAYDALDAAFETVAALSYDAIDIKDTLRRLDRLEHLRRRLPATEHQLLAHAQTRTTPKEIGAKSWADVLATRLRISTTEATRRVKEAEDLGPRTALTGQPLPPRLPRHRRRASPRRHQRRTRHHHPHMPQRRREVHRRHHPRRDRPGFGPHRRRQHPRGPA